MRFAMIEEKRLDTGFHRYDELKIPHAPSAGLKTRPSKAYMLAPPCQINHTLVFVVRTFRCAGLAGLKTWTTFWFHPLDPPPTGGGHEI